MIVGTNLMIEASALNFPLCCGRDLECEESVDGQSQTNNLHISLLSLNSTAFVDRL